MLHQRALVPQLPKLGLIHVSLGMEGSGGALSSRQCRRRGGVRHTLTDRELDVTRRLEVLRLRGDAMGEVSWVHWGLPKLLAFYWRQPHWRCGRVDAGEVGVIRDREET